MISVYFRREAFANSSSLPRNTGTCLHSSNTTLRHSQRHHYRVALYLGIPRPVMFLKACLAFMLVVNMAFHNDINDVTARVTHLVPTQSRKWEIHPMSIIFGYRIDTVLRALLFTGARSLIAATRLFCRTSTFRCRTSIIILASSSPLTELLTSRNRTRRILTSHSWT